MRIGQRACQSRLDPPHPFLSRPTPDKPTTDPNRMEGVGRPAESRSCWTVCTPNPDEPMLLAIAELQYHTRLVCSSGHALYLQQLNITRGGFHVIKRGVYELFLPESLLYLA